MKKPVLSKAGPQLSSWECTDLCEQGKCFLCKETGHFAKVCPKANLVRSDRKDKPLGLTSYYMELKTDNLAEHLQDLATTMETTTGIDLHAIEGSWCDLGPDALPAYQYTVSLGDCVEFP